MAVKAVQQFMLRKELGSEKKARKTLTLMRDCGYNGIELCGFMIKKISLFVRILTSLAGMGVGKSGSLDWKQLTREYGLKVVSLHEDMGTILNKTNQVISDAKELDTDTVVLTGMFRYDYTDHNNVFMLCKKLNKAGKLLKDGGIKFLYHNHNCEFVRTKSGERPIDIILAETDPEFVNFEFDSYWAADAGVDCVEFMHTLGERMKLYHINDRVSIAKGSANSILKADGTELGKGNMNLTALIRTAESLGVEAIILESHRNWADNSALQSLKISSELLNYAVKNKGGN